MLKIQNLKIKNKRDNKIIIEQANLVLNNGQITLLEGVNGSGKSTLLNAIMRHPDYEVEQGEIFLNDKDIRDLGTEQLAKLGLYLSMQHSPEITGVTTVKMLYKAFQILNPEDNISILDFKKNLEDLSEAFGLDVSLLGREINVGYSGGEKKQADLMHMLALNPSVILMDEPDSGVDKDAVSKVYAVIKHFRDKGAAILVTSHNERIGDLNLNKIYKIENSKVTIVKM